MTRGRQTNIAHLVADSVDDAREQWIAVFARDRADLGPAHAAERAAAEAARYAQHRPVELALWERRRAWRDEAEGITPHYERFGDHLPKALWDELDRLRHRLG